MAGRHRAPRPPLHRRMASWLKPAKPTSHETFETRQQPQTAADLLHQLES